MPESPPAAIAARSPTPFERFAEAEAEAARLMVAYLSDRDAAPTRRTVVGQFNVTLGDLATACRRAEALCEKALAASALQRQRLGQAFTLKIETGNAAFDGPDRQTEIARILRRAAKRIEEDGESGGPLIDANGNKVGSFLGA